MKTPLITLLLVGILTCSSQLASAQCNDQLIGISAELLNDFTYIKDIKVRMPKAKRNKMAPSNKYSVILSKGMKYRFVGTNAEEFDGKLIFKIFNQQNVLVLTNYNQQTEKIYDVVDFTCQSSGQYYVEVSFQDGQEGCAVCVIGFRRKKSSLEQYLDQ